MNGHGERQTERAPCNFGWVVDEKVAAMGAPCFSAQDGEGERNFLQSCGITAVVSLTLRSYEEAFRTAGFDYLHEPVPDMGIPSMEQLARIVDFMARTVEGGGKVVIHCSAGYGRTGTVLACYLVHEGETPWEAMDRIRRVRPGSVETLLQENLVVDFYARVAEKRPARRKGENKPFCYSHPRPMVTVDAALFAGHGEDLRILLVKRGKGPFQGAWALPGGFLQLEETLEAAVARELEEETGLRNVYLEPFRTYGDPGRDPRGRTLSIVFVGLLPAATAHPNAGSDAAAAEWFPVDAIPELAFDHGRIAADALAHIRKVGK